ncbi:hypothetical protein N7523_007934 [Penicillium sp. IBT 18751x]|nr:hypothetical protein N7523_007934 [Penicillium sp. IBT 18751x]
MKYERMPIEIESPEEYGYDKIKYNLSESSVADQSLESLGLNIPNLTLLYNEHQGDSRLREIIASDAGLSKDDVLITGGAAGALLSLRLRNWHPRITSWFFVDLEFESGFQPNVAFIESCITPKTKMVSITCPHNPTGTLITREALDELVALTKRKNCLLLVDETYRDVHYGTQLPIAASLGDHVLSVSSLSKSFGVPGIRLGWVTTQNKTLQEIFLAAKEQISISGSVINEWVATQLLSNRHNILAMTNEEMGKRLDMVKSWIEREELLEWIEPAGGVVCFPRMKKEPAGGTAAFYERLLKKYQTYVGPGHWFGMPDTYFRLGFGWPTREELAAGMGAITKALRDDCE